MSTATPIRAVRIHAALAKTSHGRGPSRWHALMLDGRGRAYLVLCGKVRLDNLGRPNEAHAVDCPRCLRALAKDGRGERRAGGLPGL